MKKMKKKYRVNLECNFEYPKCWECGKELKEDAMLIKRKDETRFEIYCIDCSNDEIVENMDDYLLDCPS